MSPIPDAVSAAPDIYRVLLENERVRVLDVRMRPGASSPMHSHPDLISYALNPGKLRFTLPGGESMDVELRPGEAMWIDAPTHATENIGPTETHDLPTRTGPVCGQTAAAQGGAEVTPGA